MDSSDLLDQTFVLLANDASFLNFKGLTPQSDISLKVAYIQKEEETDGIVNSTTIPIVLMYIRPGHPDRRSSTVYIGKVVIDCFAKDGNTARMMVKRSIQLLHNWTTKGIYVARFAYDTSFKTGITGVKGHRVFFDASSYIG